VGKGKTAGVQEIHRWGGGPWKKGKYQKKQKPPPPNPKKRGLKEIYEFVLS